MVAGFTTRASSIIASAAAPRWRAADIFSIDGMVDDKFEVIKMLFCNRSIDGLIDRSLSFRLKKRMGKRERGFES